MGGIGGPGGIGGAGGIGDRPQNRPNWGDWSQGRNDNWQQRVNNRSDSWNNWQSQNQQRLNNFQANRDQRWNNLQGAQENRQNWRDQNREDWQQHREDMWDYRFDRADEVWDRAGDLYDNYFDDHWWGGLGYGYYGMGSYPSNPWWWWASAGWSAVSGFVNAITPEPAYIDHGMTVVYEGDTVYVDNKPVPAAQYSQPVMEMAETVEQPPPPAPPAPGQKQEWMPLGVFALAQEERGDPIMFFQLSVDRSGLISGAYQSTLTDDQRTVAGKVDIATQRAAWRIGENHDTIFETALANLTEDVSTVAIHFGDTRTQTWLLVRMPEPPQTNQPAKPLGINRTIPPVKKTTAPAPAPKK